MRRFFYILFLMIFAVSSAATTVQAAPSTPKVNVKNNKGEITQIFCGVPIETTEVIASDAIYPDVETCHTDKLSVPPHTNNDVIPVPDFRRMNGLSSSTSSLYSAFTTPNVDNIYTINIKSLGVANGFVGMMNTNSPYNTNPLPTNPDGREWTAYTVEYPAGNSCMYVEVYHDVSSGFSSHYAVFGDQCVSANTIYYDMYNPAFRGPYIRSVLPYQEQFYVQTRRALIGNGFTTYLYNNNTGTFETALSSPNTSPYTYGALSAKIGGSQPIGGTVWCPHLEQSNMRMQDVRFLDNGKYRTPKTTDIASTFRSGVCANNQWVNVWDTSSTIMLDIRWVT